MSAKAKKKQEIKPEEKEDRGKSQAATQLESIKEMVKTLDDAREKEEDDAIEKAERAIEENVLSVEVRSAWHTPREEMPDREYRILLCWGGPSCQIVGNLSEHGEPETARLEYQDWFTKWAEYPLSGEDSDALFTYARIFYFGE